MEQQQEEGRQAIDDQRRVEQQWRSAKRQCRHLADEEHDGAGQAHERAGDHRRMMEAARRARPGDGTDQRGDRGQEERGQESRRRQTSRASSSPPEAVGEPLENLRRRGRVARDPDVDGNDLVDRTDHGVRNRARCRPCRRRPRPRRPGTDAAPRRRWSAGRSRGCGRPARSPSGRRRGAATPRSSGRTARCRSRRCQARAVRVPRRWWTRRRRLECEGIGRRQRSASTSRTSAPAASTSPASAGGGPAGSVTRGSQQQRVQQANERHAGTALRVHSVASCQSIARDRLDNWELTAGESPAPAYFTVNGTDAILLFHAISSLPEFAPVAVSVIFNVSIGAGGLLMSIATRPRSWSLL